MFPQRKKKKEIQTVIGLIFLSGLELAGVRTLRTVVKMADRLFSKGEFPL